MTTILRSRAGWGLALALLAAVVLGLAAGSSAFAASGSGSSGSGSSGSTSGSGSSGGGSATADFAFSANYKPPFFVGYVVRGGLLSCAACTGSYEPRYRVTGFTLGWDGNTLGFTSLDDFSGPVTIEITGLPAGVASETATSVTVPRRGSVGTALHLSAASSAPLSPATITVRATGGGTVHTIALPIEVVDALPTS